MNTKQISIPVIVLTLLLICNPARAATKNFSLTTLGQVTNLTATAVAGGGLAAGKTYYFSVFAVNGTGLTTNTRGQMSATATATTDATNKQINLAWDAVPSATYYCIYFSEDTNTLADYNEVKWIYNGSDSYYSYYRSTNTNSFTFDENTPVQTSKHIYEEEAIPNLTFSGGDSDDPMTFEDIYQAFVTNEWSGATKDWYTYRFWCHMTAGNPTYLKDTNKVVVIRGFFNMAFTGSGNALQLGTSVGSGSDSYKSGCTIVFRGYRLDTWNSFFKGYSAGDNYLYGCRIIGQDLSGTQPGMWQHRVHLEYLKLRESWFDGFDTVNVIHAGSEVDAKRCTFVNSEMAPWGQAMQYDAIYNWDEIAVDTAPYSTYDVDCLVTKLVDHTTDSGYVIRPVLYPNQTGDRYIYVDDTRSAFSPTVKITWNTAVTDYNKHVMERYTFNLRVLDKDGNPISGATVEIKDKNGDTVLLDSSVSVTAAVSPSATTITVDDTSSLSAGDMVKLNAEWMQIVSVDSGTQITVTRSQRNTQAPIYSHRVYRDKPLYREASSLTTDASGDILEQKIVRSKYSYGKSGSNGMHAAVGVTVNYFPFTVSISKDGYATYEGKVSDITGAYTGDSGLSVRLTEGDTVIYDSTFYDSTIY